MVAHEALEQFGAVLHRGLALADDGEIDERSARARLVGLPELLQLAGDGGDFDGVPKVAAGAIGAMSVGMAWKSGARIRKTERGVAKSCSPRQYHASASGLKNPQNNLSLDP